MYCLASIVVIAQTAVFAYIWYDFYRGLIFEPFWRKGNLGSDRYLWTDQLYVLQVLRGLRVGYLKNDRCILLYDSCCDLYKYHNLPSDHSDQ